MGGMGPGGLYSQQPGINSGRMTPQGPPYTTPSSGEPQSDMMDGWKEIPARAVFGLSSKNRSISTIIK